MLLDRLRWEAFRANSALLHRLRRRFTPAGLLFLCALAGAALWGVDTTQSMAYQAFTLCAGVTLLAWLGSARGPRGLSARRVLPRHGTAGVPLRYRLVVENLGRRPRRGVLLAEDLPDPRPDWSEFRAASNPDDVRPLWKDMRHFWFDRFAGYSRWRGLVALKRQAEGGEAAVPELSPRGRAELDVTLLPARRGRLALPGLLLSEPEPLGLAKSWRAEPRPESVLILPKRYPVPRLDLPGPRRLQPGGVALSSSVGDSQEFMSLRDYRPGDPPRRMHWRSFAKTGRPVVKEYEDEYFTRHALVLDTFARPGQGEAFEEAVSVAASFACSVLTQESLLDLLFVGAHRYCFTAGRGVGGVERLLEVLACAQPCRDRPFAALRASVLGRHARLSGVVCVLLGLDELRRGFLAELRGLGLAVRAFVVTRRPEEAPREAGVQALELGKVAEGLARTPP